MSPVWISALVRSVIGAGLTGALVFLTGLQQGQSYRTAGITAGIAVLSYLLVRLAAEGLIDSSAAATSAAAKGP